MGKPSGASNKRGSKGKPSQKQKQQGPPSRSSNTKNVGQTRMGYDSGERGLWMNMNLDVRRLTDSMGEVRQYDLLR